MVHAPHRNTNMVGVGFYDSAGSFGGLPWPFTWGWQLIIGTAHESGCVVYLPVVPCEACSPRRKASLIDYCFSALCRLSLGYTPT